jgi:hypothetical protein
MKKHMSVMSVLRAQKAEHFLTLFLFQSLIAQA